MPDTLATRRSSGTSGKTVIAQDIYVKRGVMQAPQNNSGLRRELESGAVNGNRALVSSARRKPLLTISEQNKEGKEKTNRMLIAAAAQAEDVIIDLPCTLLKAM